MLSIKAIPSTEGEKFGFCNIHPEAPQGNALFIAPSNSGKTTLMVNLVLRRVFGIITSYETIHIISPTVFMDDNWEMVRPNKYKQVKLRCEGGRKVKSAEIIVHDDYDISIIEHILNVQDNKAANKRKRILIILDDIADSIVQHPVLDRLFFRGRHSGVFCWISSQLYHRVPRGVRVNAPYYVFFRVNTNEVNRIADELAVETKKGFIGLLNRATFEKFSFLTINAKRSGEGRYTKSFQPISE